MSFGAGVFLGFAIYYVLRWLVDHTTEGKQRKAFVEARSQAVDKYRNIPVYEPLANRTPRVLPADPHALISDYEDLVHALGKMSASRVETPEGEAAYTRDALYVRDEVRRFRLDVLERLTGSSTAAAEPESL